MNQSKRYLDIVKEIRDMIRQENIKPGDRIPSERELAEKLQVGRSTLREALRSLELLGLIETRRGEGTFLSDHRNHKLVEVLSTFILQDNKSREDVWETRLMHEISAIQSICRNEALAELRIWDSFKNRLKEDTFQRDDFVRELMVLSGNRLSLKIWFLLHQYSGSPYSQKVEEDEKELMYPVLDAVESHQEEAAIQAFRAWSEWIEKRRMLNGDNS